MNFSFVAYKVETVVSCFIVSIISVHPRIERGSPLISSVLSLYCILMVATAIVGESSPTGLMQVLNAHNLVNIPRTEIFVHVVAMGGLSSMIAVFYSSLYYFSAHRYVQVETSDHLRMTSDDESGSVIFSEA
jgi:hypothetical protein